MADVLLTWDPRLLKLEIVAFADDGGNQIKPELGIVAGAAAWMGGGDGRTHAALCFACPCGCGSWHCLSIRKPDGGDRPSWEWDGNVATPSLQPSVQCTTPCRWHGYLTTGIWKSC